MEAVVIALLFAPSVVAFACLLVSIQFMARMFGHMRQERRLLAYVAGPAALFLESLYTPKGVRLLRAHRRWFNLFGIWLLSSGALWLCSFLFTKLL
jgi:hypothetical protein